MLTRVALVSILLMGCNNSGSPPSGAPPGAAGAAPTGAMPAGRPAAGGSLACDEALYQKWLSYAKEQGTLIGGGLMKDAAKVATSGSAAATADLVQAGMQVQELQKKYGFTQHDVTQLSGLAGVIMEMHQLESPMLKDTVEMMRKMQGDQTTKANADKFFQDAADQAKKAEARGREKYGDACVDVFAKHAAEVMDVQISTAMNVLGGASKPK